MEKVNRKKISKILIIFILVCALSITTYAEYIFNEKNVTQLRLWGRTSASGSDTWREVSFEIQDNEIVTAYQTYGQSRQRIQANFNKIIPATNIYVSFTYVLNPDIYNPANINFGTEYENITYITSNNSDTKYFDSTMINKSRKVENNTVKYIFEYNGTEVSIYGLRIFTNLITVSTEYRIRNFEIVINGEEYKIVKEWDNKIEDAQSMIDQMTMDMPDQEDYVNDIKSNIRPMDESYSNSFSFFEESHFLTTIVLMSIAFATISFILYGKKEAK